MSEKLFGILVDDIYDVCTIYKRALERTEQVKILATYNSGREILNAPEEILTQASFIMSDVGLKDKSGVDVAMQIRNRYRRKPILLYTSYTEDETILKIGQANLSSHYGVVLRKSIVDSEQLLPILRTIVRGGIYRSPEIETRLSIFRDREKGSPLRLLERAEPGLIQIFTLNAWGFSNKQIAHKTGYSEKSVSLKLAKIYELLNLTDELDDDNGRELRRRRAAIMYHANRILYWSLEGEPQTYNEIDELVPLEYYTEQIKRMLREAPDFDVSDDT